MTYSVAAFYKFVTIADGAALRRHLEELCTCHSIIGTILIAPEGINATIAGSATELGEALAQMACDARFCDLDIKRSACETQPFQRLKVKLKREIVTFGVPSANPALQAGTYVDATDWNALIADPNVVLVDTRNAYEIKVGTFPGALDPQTQSFGQFPAFVELNRDALANKKVAMFCTGGIRCEKASAYLLQEGFKDVHHLKGGILKYLEMVPPEKSVWQGECFVFDERVALQHGVTQGSTSLCPNCGAPLAEGQACATCTLAPTAPDPSAA